MTVWIIEPHDPLIVRDGKPFGPNPGARASSLAFPFPSTTTGGVRTRAGLKAGVFDASANTIEQVKTIKVKGPFLVQLQPDVNTGGIEEWLVPAPLDALLLDDKDTKETICRQLVPLEMKKDMYSNLEPKQLWLVGLQKRDQRKPSKNAPKYWYWKQFERWLLNPSEGDGKSTPTNLGLSGPQREYRTHVSIDEKGFVAKEGALFTTSGLDFTITFGKQETRLNETKRLALAMEVENGTKLPIQEGLGSFGGERRVVSWRETKDDLPKCPEDVRKEIIRQRACRVILLTPTYFAKGSYPDRVLQENNAVKPDLKAIAIQRPQVVSGWNLEKREPKPSCRLAPVGTVLFLKLDDNASNKEVEDWIASIWMKCISDKAEDGSDSYCNDGFGLAVLGTWSGKPVAMEQEDQP